MISHVIVVFFLQYHRISLVANQLTSVQVTDIFIVVFFMYLIALINNN